MRLSLGPVVGVSLALFVVAAGLASFALDPENLGGRLALYAIAGLALLVALLGGVVALVRRLSRRR